MKKSHLLQFLCQGGIFAIIMTFCSLPSAASSNNYFNDVLPDHWAFESITEATNQGFAQGYEDGTFRPDLPATYAHVSAFLLRSFYPSDVTVLSDISSKWSDPYIQAMISLISNPQTIDLICRNSNNPITTYDMAQMMYDILVDHNVIDVSNPPAYPSLEQLHLLDSVPAPYYPAVSSVFSLGLLDGIFDISSLQNGYINRAQACAAIVRLSRYINPMENTSLSGLIIGCSLTITDFTSDSVYFDLKNAGNRTFSHEGTPSLELYKDGVWFDVPSLSGTFTDISILRQLAPGQRKTLSSNLTSLYGSLSPGLYRLSLEISQNGNRFLLTDVFSTIDSID